MKPLYAKVQSLQTEASLAFGKEIDAVVRGIMEKYIRQGYCVRHLSHEAMSIVKDIELDHIMDIQYEAAKHKQNKESKAAKQIKETNDEKSNSD